ncbi:MAG: T9SS type A sorting domain-containing protein [Chryseobacterium sp.]|nr:T9SS type A sorting domain-containing protein [Chryseobacterium sp.]
MRNNLLYLILLTFPLLGLGQNSEERCLNAPYGQWPDYTFIPTCFGSAGYITDVGWAGQYTKVQLTAGVEYIFRSSTTNGNNPDFITIALENGDVALASGTGSVTYTSPVDQIVRFFSHKDENCTAEQVSRLRTVQCGVPFVAEVPEYPCFQGDGLSSNGFEIGYNVSPYSGIRVADDFHVNDSEVFNLKYVRLNAFMLPFAIIKDVKFNIRSDENGTPSESDIVASFSATPVSKKRIGYNLGHSIFQLEFELDSPIQLSAGRYWLQPELSLEFFGYAFWETTSTGSSGKVVQISQDGAPWIADPGNRQAVFFVAGECDLLGVNEVGKSAITYYPNPVKDKLNITSKNIINKISIYNHAGQLVMSDAKIDKGQIDVARLTTGTYIVRVMLEKGKMENLKILKK